MCRWRLDDVVGRDEIVVCVGWAYGVREFFIWRYVVLDFERSSLGR